MRIIPKNTKVSTEFFKGVTLADMIVGFVGVMIVFLLAISSLPHRGYIALGFGFVLVFLLVRIDDESNYMFLFRIIRHFSYFRSYQKPGFTYPEAIVEGNEEEGSEVSEIIGEASEEVLIQEVDTATPVISLDIPGDMPVLEKEQDNPLHTELEEEGFEILDLDEVSVEPKDVKKPTDAYAGMKKKAPQSVWKNLKNKSQKAKKGDF